LSETKRVNTVQMVRYVLVNRGLEKYHILKSANASSIVINYNTYEIIKSTLSIVSKQKNKSIYFVAMQVFSSRKRNKEVFWLELNTCLSSSSLYF